MLVGRYWQNRKAIYAKLAFIITKKWKCSQIISSMTKCWRGHYISCPQTNYWGHVPIPQFRCLWLYWDCLPMRRCSLTCMSPCHQSANIRQQTTARLYLFLCCTLLFFTWVNSCQVNRMCLWETHESTRRSTHGQLNTFVELIVWRVYS